MIFGKDKGTHDSGDTVSFATVQGFLWILAAFKALYARFWRQFAVPAGVCHLSCISPTFDTFRLRIATDQLLESARKYSAPQYGHIASPVSLIGK